jgi:hypothetical protein
VSVLLWLWIKSSKTKWSDNNHFLHIRFYHQFINCPVTE